MNSTVDNFENDRRVKSEVDLRMTRVRLEIRTACLLGQGLGGLEIVFLC